MFRRLQIAMATAMAVLTAPAGAATLTVVDGQLFGATAVDVSGSLYDVEFVDGTCAGVFSGCDDLGDFAFNSLVEAEAAAFALLDQVILDGPDGNFDSNPGLTNGIIAGGALAHIFSPYGFGMGTNVLATTARNTQPPTPNSVGSGAFNRNSDASALALITFARWSPAQSDPIAPIPLPAGGVLLLSGVLVFLGFGRRRHR